MGIRGMAFVFVVLAVLGFTAYDYWDKQTNYEPVMARVTRVDEQCYMEKKERGVLTKTTSTSDLLPCPIAEKLVVNHPKWYGYTVKMKIEVGYLFTSPVDGKAHAAKRQMSDYPEGHKLGVGDVVPIRASKTDDSKVREL